MSDFVKSMGNDFREVVKGENFMTPDVIQYFSNGKLDVELSVGKDFNGGEMFGVTVVDIEAKKQLRDKSELFTNIDLALSYIHEEL